MGTYFSHATTGGGGGGSAVTIADGANVVEGTTTDAAVTGDNPGTISGKLRGLTKILTDVWDSVNHLLKVSVSNFPGTQPVSGTVTANQGSANATPWNDNIAQFGGSAVVTGAGAGGAGIPRVTISNDSSLAANQSVNVAQVGGNNTSVNAGISGTGTQRVVQATANVVNITQVTVPTTAGGISLIAANANRLKLRITNTGTNPVYIFNTSGPTTANGDFLAGIIGYPWMSRYEGQLWGIASGGSQVVTVYEESSA